MHAHTHACTRAHTHIPDQSVTADLKIKKMNILIHNEQTEKNVKV